MDSEWYDLYDFDNTANFCIKGLVSSEPDLECMGSLVWNDIQPGSEIGAYFTLENIGDPDSKLDWGIIDHPSWGEWNFSPDGGVNLKPEDGVITVDVNVISPDEKEKLFSGNITIINNNDDSDFHVIEVSLTTPNNYKSSEIDIFRFINQIIEKSYMLNLFFSFD